MPKKPDPGEWKIVLSYLHHSGEFHGTLSQLDETEIRLLADGFGDLFGLVGSNDMTVAEANQCLWDWSHVRDSTRSAVSAMAGALTRRADRLASAE